MREINKRPSEIDKIIGKNLKSIREFRRFTQQELGEKLGVTYQQIQKYEKGRNRMAASRLEEMSNVLQCPIGIFFTLEISKKFKILGQKNKSYADFLDEMDEGLGNISDFLGVALPDELLNNAEKRTENLFSLCIFWILRTLIKREQVQMERGCND
ncbi:MAG: helix-turn-helix domain-containing protein [Holosporaceae bacterium]|jgi:transcriptional regulator with XRE-family HTH domain|nr:helix-turn-helix domain-containing protein [Holosporaceae bacterium]